MLFVILQLIDTIQKTFDEMAQDVFEVQSSEVSFYTVISCLFVV